MSDRDSTVDVRVLFTLTLVHFLGDFYSSFIHPLLPLFVKRFALSLAQVGLITGLSRLLAFIVQPTVGYMADHYRSRFFVLAGPLLPILFIPLVGVAPSFPLLLAFIALGSVGSSMFHPTLAGMVSAYAGRHFGFSMSIFNMGGTLAFGVGPLFITTFVGSLGLSWTPATAILGLVAMVLPFRIIPHPQGEGLRRYGFLGSLRQILGGVWRHILIIWTVMVLRAFVGQSFLTFIPVLYAREGFSLLSIGTMVSLFTVAGALSGLLAGRMADRIGYKPIFLATFGLATPGLYLLVHARGGWVYPSVFLTGFLVLATLPLGVAMAQEFAPKGRSMVSSLMMGLAFGTGGMLTPLTGKLADIFSIREVLSALSILPVLCVGLIVLLPEARALRKEDGDPSD